MLTTAVLSGGAVLCAAAAFRWMRPRRVKDEAVHRFRCPGCLRKLRCRASQAKRGGLCPHCGQVWTGAPPTQGFPTPRRSPQGYLVRVGRRMPVQPNNRYLGNRVDTLLESDSDASWPSR